MQYFTIKTLKERKSLATGLQLLFLTSLLLMLVILSAGMGYMEIPMNQVVDILTSRLSGDITPVDRELAVRSMVLLDIRLPRILTAAVVGGGLAIAGVVFQAILLNPLADPFTLGISAGAAFGAAVAILLNLGAFAVSVPLFAFTGAVSTLFAVLYLSSTRGGFSSNNLILSGIIVGAILSAGISFLKYVADEQVSVIIFWLMGSFASRTWGDLWLAVVFVTLGLIIFIYFARDLNVLCLGNRVAASLGVNTQRTTLVLLITASMVAAICVSVSGIIGFVGLLVPHIVRSFTGPDNLRLLPISLLGGALLLLLADTVTRAVLPHEVPIGVLTALIGGLFFCWLFKKSRAASGGM